MQIRKERVFLGPEPASPARPNYEVVGPNYRGQFGSEPICPHRSGPNYGEDRINEDRIIEVRMYAPCHVHSCALVLRIRAPGVMVMPSIENAVLVAYDWPTSDLSVLTPGRPSLEMVVLRCTVPKLIPTTGQDRCGRLT
jgi:hypothetical protein